MTTKTCKTCLHTLTLDNFYPHKKSRAGVLAHCKDCTSAKRKATYCPEKAFSQLIKSRYKLSVSDYRELLAKQDNKCAICFTADPGDYHGRFCIDHDHATGHVRGLLCHNCNVALGSFRDSVANLLNAALYLQR